MINKNYTLHDIEKIFKFTPSIFIIIIAIISIIATYLILDFKKARELDLIKQKQILHNDFAKENILNSFVNNIKNKIDTQFDDTKLNIRKIVYKTIGHIETSNKNNIYSKEVFSYLKNIEQKHNINMVIFQKNNLNVLFGDNEILKLEKLMFNSKDSNKFKNLLLNYIASQGENNLQYWKYDLQKSLILSFFDIYTINNEQYFVGCFSQVSNIKALSKQIILKNIQQINTKQNYKLWFYDLNLKKTYNLENKTHLDHQIIKYYSHHQNINKTFNKYLYLYKEFGYFVSIQYDKFTKNKSKIAKITQEYQNLFYKIITFIVFITSVFIIFSIIFAKLIKKIFLNYNNKLIEQTKSLEHWKKRFELAIIASNDGLWDIDFQNNSIYFSDKWLEMFGYTKGDIHNFDAWLNLIHKKDKNKVSKQFDDILHKKTDTFLCEYRLKTKDNKYKWIFARGRIFVDELKNSKRMLMMSMDIDKNKKMTKELLDVELLVEDERMVIFKCNNNKELSINYISKSIEYYGYKKDDFENNIIHLKDILLQTNKIILDNAIKDAIKKNKKSFSCVLKIYNQQNEIKWIFLRAILLKDDFSYITQFYGYLYDITKIKVSQEELKLKVKTEVQENIKKDRLLVQQSKLASMGEMLGNISHQWRQPLNTVNLILHFIRDNFDNDDFTKEILEKYINKSKIQIDYMSQTIDDFRNFYKPSKKINTFDISSCIYDVIKILNEQFKQNEITLNLNLDKIVITNYENELKQSLLNILNNAKDALILKKSSMIFDANIEINLSKIDSMVQIQIKNNGDCIKEDIIEKVFEPYFTTKFETQGTGIGLYMSRTIIQTNMRGKISVKNISNGVLFTIILPLEHKIKGDYD
jgi:PAS domain S-box-containing protein